jgi:hypothetical protein
VKKENSNAPNVEAEKANPFLEIFTPRRRKKVKLFSEKRRRCEIRFFPQNTIEKRRGRGQGLICLFVVLSLQSLISCSHVPQGLPVPDRESRIFDVKEEIIFRALTRVLKDRGFGVAEVNQEKGTIITDYIVQENWRFKVEGEVKKVSKREREVFLTLTTEEQSSSGWKPRKLLGKEQYEKLFDELEMQIYRELSKGN